MSVWQFVQDEILGMKWLNRLIGNGLSMLGMDIDGGMGGSVQFFLYDVIKITVLLCFLIFIISWFMMTQCRFGKNIFAIGGNDQAARVAGINVEKNLVLTYMWSGICAGLAGALLAARTGSADPSTNGLQYEFDAIAAATVGGTSQTGGVCRMSGVMSGILVLGVINNGLVLLGANDNLTQIIKGLIIVGAVVVDMRKNAKKP